MHKKSLHLNRPAFTAAADKVCTRTKKKGQKKAKKRHRRAKSPGLAAQRGIGGRSVVAASASLGAGLGVHFMPAASRRQRRKLVDSLVCILFAGRTAGGCPASVCTFCRIVSALYAYEIRQNAGFLVCTLFAGKASFSGVSLVYALFHNLRLPCMHTFCKQNGAA